MQNGAAFKVLSAAAGEIQLTAIAGVVRLVSGGIATGGLTSFVPDTLGMTELVLDPTGGAVLECRMGAPTASPAPFGKVEVGKLGASLYTPTGGISIDMKGGVALGGPAGHGAVVTTLTHPICYVTGLPINGVTTVGASGIPGPVYIPNAFVKDPTIGPAKS